MDFDDLEITRLGIGDTFSGIYRGQRVHQFPKFKEQEPEFVARVFLDVAGGPVAVKVDESAIEQIEVLEVIDGDRIVVIHSPDDRYVVHKDHD